MKRLVLARPAGLEPATLGLEIHQGKIDAQAAACHKRYFYKQLHFLV